MSITKHILPVLKVILFVKAPSQYPALSYDSDDFSVTTGQCVVHTVVRQTDVSVTNGQCVVYTVVRQTDVCVTNGQCVVYTVVRQTDVSVTNGQCVVYTVVRQRLIVAKQNF